MSLNFVVHIKSGHVDNNDVCNKSCLEVVGALWRDWLGQMESGIFWNFKYYFCFKAYLTANHSFGE